jgi:predicted nucleotide-binding protein
MATKKTAAKPASATTKAIKEFTKRTFPRDSLQRSLVIAEKIRDEKAGQPIKRVLLANALGMSPESTNFKYLLSSSSQYGLTKGTEKAPEISITDLGRDAINQTDAEKRTKALRKAARTPASFGQFYTNFDQHLVPTTLAATMESDYGVSAGRGAEAVGLVLENGRFVGIIKTMSGKDRVILDSDDLISSTEHPSIGAIEEESSGYDEIDDDVNGQLPDSEPKKPTTSKPIFVGHGKNKKPLEEVKKVLDGLKIPYKVAISEPNLGRPIPDKVKAVMDECGSAILIFTKDELLYDKDQNEVWRPSENVVYELGASSFAYENRIVIFKEDGINFPANFGSVGRIDFSETQSIASRTLDLVQELVGFNLVKIIPT